ncbi:MAG: DUF11 domain-containing protein [Clostridia bacterium]|nr:DUF11 domain-containing protein [Clostridia bacterium]
MKKFLALLLAVLAVLTLLTACGDKTPDASADGKDNSQNQQDTTPPDDKQEDNSGEIKLPDLSELDQPDPRWAHEVYHENFEYLKATANAYFNRLRYIQYDQLNMNRIGKTSMRTERVTPETATANKIVHMDCGVFIRNVYEQTIGYVMDSASSILGNDYPNTYGERVFHFVGTLGQTPDVEAQAKEELLSIIQPGDILYYNYVENNHLWLYMGEGNMLHCTGNDYGYNTYKDDVEENGAIRRITIDDAIAERDLFDEKNKVALLRPFNAGGVVNEQAKIRAEKLQNIVIYKTSTAPEGISVTPGEEVTITIQIKNNRLGEDATFSISDYVPNGMEYVSGADTYDNGELKWTVTVPGRKSVTIEYTLRVKKDASLIGELIHLNNTEIEGYLLNDTPVYVGVTLSADKQAAITDIATSSLKAATEEALIKEIYSAIGMGVAAQSSEKYLSDLFRNYPSNEAKAQTGPLWTADTITGLSFVPNLYGGKACNDLSDGVGIRIRGVYEQTVIPGDIIVSTLMLSEGYSRLYVYMGDGRTVTVEDGKVTEVSAELVLDGLFGQSAFCILRPSLCYPLDESTVGELNAPAIKTQPVDMEVAYGAKKGPSIAVEAESGVAYSYQWYQTAQPKNSGGTAIKGAVKSQLAMSDAFVSGETAYVYCVVTATRAFDGKTAETVSQAAKLTVGQKTVNVLLVGSGAVRRDGKFDMGEYLGNLFKAAGVPAKIDYITRGNDYNIWESGLTGSGRSTVKEQLEAKTYDAVIIQLGRDNVLTTTSTRGEEISAFKTIYNAAKNSSPDVQVIALLPPWRQNTSGSWYGKYADRGSSIKTAVDHREAILAYYEESIKTIAEDIKCIDTVTAFINALDKGINPFESETSDYAGLSGGYLMACIAYGQITGTAPVGLNVFESEAGTVSAADAKTMQEIASDLLGLEYTPTELDPGAEIDPSIKPDDDGKMNVLIIGSGAVKRDGKFDVGEYLGAMLKTENQPVTVDYITRGNDYNLFESGLVGSGRSKVKEKLEEKVYDAVIIQVGRDHVVSTASTRSEEVSSFKNIVKLIRAASPDAQIMVVMGPWRQNTAGSWYTKYQSRGANIYTEADHKRGIMEVYEEYIKPVDAELKLIDTITAFEQAQSANIDPFGQGGDMDYPGPNGAYLMACIAYAHLTGKTPVGVNEVTEVGTLTADQITTLQQIAQEVAPGN